MKTQHLSLAVLGLALCSGTGLAQTIITQQPAVSETIITREPAPVTGQLVLTPAQRTTVYRTIVRERPVTPAPAAVEVQVGQRIPAGVQLYAVPETVGVEVPTIKSYKYMYVNNRVVLVDPATSMVVGEIAE